MRRTTKDRWRRFGLGMIDAAINSAATSISVIIVDPVDFNLLQGGAWNLGALALVSAILGIAMYLKNNRLPGVEEEYYT